MVSVDGSLNAGFLYFSLPDARPVPVKMGLVQAGSGETEGNTVNFVSDPGKLGSLSVSSYSPYSMRAVHYTPLGPSAAIHPPRGHQLEQLARTQSGAAGGVKVTMGRPLGSDPAKLDPAKPRHSGIRLLPDGRKVGRGGAGSAQS